MNRTFSALLLALSLSSLGFAQQAQDAPTPPPPHGTPQTDPHMATQSASGKPAGTTTRKKKKKKPATASQPSADAVHGTPQTGPHATPQSSEPK